MRRVLHALIFISAFVAVRTCGPERAVDDVRRSSYEAVLGQAYLRASTALGTTTGRALTASDNATITTLRLLADARDQIGTRVSASAASLTASARRLFADRPSRPQPPAPSTTPDDRRTK